MSENLTENDLLLLIVKNLVEKPAAVSVIRSTDDKGVLLTLTVDPLDMGKIIGKSGQTAQALRLIIRGKGRRNNATVSVKIVDPSNTQDTVAL